MKHVILSITLFLVACSSVSVAQEPASYGDGVTIDVAVSVAELMAKPDQYVGKTVRVDGVVTGVCKKRGCWMQVTDPVTGKGIRVKVQDGVMVFPYSLMGHAVAAQGVFEALKLSQEQAAKMKAQYEAEQAAGKDKTGAAQEGKTCARHSSATGETLATGCTPEVHGQTIYLLRGTGAQALS